MKRRYTISLVLIIVTIMSFALPVSATADQEWPLMSKAKEYEAAGNYAEAFTYWVRLIEFYSGSNNAGQLENGGHYAMKAGDYCVGEYNSPVFDAVRATAYYETAKDFYSRSMALSGNNLKWAVDAAAQKAARFSTTVKVYAERPFSGRKTSRPLAKHEPENGMILGIYAESDMLFEKNHRTDLDLLKEHTGKDHSSILQWARWGTSAFPSAFAQILKPRGGSLQIHMTPDDGLNSVVDGAYIRQWAKDANASGIPVFLRFAGEMNGNWTQWDAQPQLIIDKFRLIHDIMAEEAPNVAMVWAPNWYPSDNYALFYPGDEYVDWVGVSCYMALGYNADTKEMILNADLIYKLSHIVEQYGGRKPIMIAEGASAYASGAESWVDYTDWAINNMNKYYSYVSRVYPEVKAIYYFSTKGGSDNYMLGQNERILANYREQISPAYFLDRMDQSAPVYYQEIDKGDFILGPTKLSAYVKTYEPVVSRVEYELKNLATGAVRALGSANKIPFEINADFSGLPSNDHDLIVRAYDSKGNLACVENIRLKAGQQAVIDKPSPWAQSYVDEASGLGLLPPAFLSGYGKAVTRAEFAALAVSLYEQLAGPITGRKPFGDTKDVNVEKAAFVGIVNGISDTMFDPGGLLTRQEAAVMLVRLADALGKPLPQAVPAFSDNDSIANWALVSVGQIQAAGVMSGVGGNSFAPKDPYTKEQSIVTVMRLRELLLSD